MDTLPPKPKKIKGATREELSNLSKDDLVDKILQLEAHNAQLKNIIAKNVSGDEETERKRKKPFDFSKCQFRRVLLRILYFGWDYQGLAVQEDTTQTIEHHLFLALTKACLIESRETSQYHRCGRTDKGVSAFGQVISISLRSSHGEGGDVSKEMPYCKILNRLLPKDIRAVAWMPIPTDKTEYSARFDCTQRQYKYYFPRGSLDISAMRCACAKLPGAHDFRHLCKMDVGNGVTQFVREVRRAEILAMEDGDGPYTMYYLLIEGNAFLWHQIRCMMGVLLLVGQGLESPDVVDELLDIDKNPRKPQYSMALDVPLNLFHCSYDLEQTQNWYYDKDELRSVISQLQSEWTVHSIKTTMFRDTLQQLENEYVRQSGSETDISEKEDRITAHTDCLLLGVKPKVYKPLLERQTCCKLVSTKWSNLRDAWMRANKNDVKKSGAGAKFSKPYIYKEQMSFLQKVAEPNRTHDSVKKRPTDTCPEASAANTTDINSERELLLPSTSKKPKTLDDKMSQFLDSRLQSDRSNEHPMLSFFKGVLPSVTSFDDSETLEFQSGVLSLIQNIKKQRESRLYSSNYGWHSQSRDHVQQSVYSSQNQNVHPPLNQNNIFPSSGYGYSTRQLVEPASPTLSLHSSNTQDSDLDFSNI